MAILRRHPRSRPTGDDKPKGEHYRKSGQRELRLKGGRKAVTFFPLLMKEKSANHLVPRVL